MSNADLVAIVGKVLGRAPAWIRHDLASEDKAVRARAEDALAAMIAAALEQERPGAQCATLSRLYRSGGGLVSGVFPDHPGSNAASCSLQRSG